VRDEACVPFLQWALPRMGMRWKGFRKVRRQVCRRIRDRIAELGLDGPEAYREHLEACPGEWDRLAILCRVTISRFARDRGVFRFLRDEVLPTLATGTQQIRAWSVGCASGEEPYTLTILWRLELEPRFPDVTLRVLATDVDPTMLERARRGRYPSGTLRELESDRVERAFQKGESEEEAFRLRQAFRAGVELRRQDLRHEMPDESFHLILCRNLAFTYFDEAEQKRVLSGLLDRLEPGGALVLGAHESLPGPEGEWPLERWSPAEPVFRKESRRTCIANIEAGG